MRNDFAMVLALAGAAATAACADDGSSDGGGTASDSSGSDTGMSTSADGGSSTVDPDSSGESTSGDATLLERVIGGLGGADRFAALERFELEVSGDRSFADEGFMPGGPPAPAHEFTNTVSVEVSTRSIAVDVSRTLTFEALGVPQTFREIVRDDVAVVDGTESLLGLPGGDLEPNRWAAITREQRLLNPHLILKDVLDGTLAASEPGTASWNGTEYELLVVETPQVPITFWVDSASDLIVRATLTENHPLRRDVELEAIYGPWDSPTDVLFPASVELRLAGDPVLRETRDNIRENPDFAAGTFEFPDGAAPMVSPEEADRGYRNHHWHRSFASVGFGQGALQSFVEGTELGDGSGVWFLTGGSHNSMVIEQANGVVVLEAPLYAERCEAILGWIDANLGGAPTTHVVVSHFHQDHSACARTLVANGAVLVIGDGSETLWDDVLAAPSTVEPDALATNPVDDISVIVVPSDGSLVLDDATNPIEIFDLDNEHSDAMVLPFVQSTGAAFVVDLFSPGFPFQIIPSGPQAILDALVTHGIDDDVLSVVGGHGGVGTVADVEAAAAPR